MKAPVNQVAVTRAHINAARVSGVRLGSALKGGQTSPYKLVQDYTFDKSNSDVDRDKVYNKLNPDEYIQLNNFDFALGSGYGLYKENYKRYIVRGVRRPNSYTCEIDYESEVNNFIVSKHMDEGCNAYRVKLTGLTSDNQLAYVYVNDSRQIVSMAFPEDGEYDLPESIKLSEPYEIGFYVLNPIVGSVFVEQIPEYPNHLVFDGVDDYTGNIPNFNLKEGTVLIQYDPIDNASVKMMTYDEGEASKFQHCFFIGSRSIQARGIDANSRIEIPFVTGNNIALFAYDDLGINIFNNGAFKTSNHINKHVKYQFGKDTNSASYAKLALKRIKVFNKKLTENQIKKEYNKLLNE